ncbi:hypothetical protein KBA41_12715 [Candidatus Ozemobacteraceae bacterium]|nr:hypothetical protein [Candidatus Ozemobacteraceae bacterium]
METGGITPTIHESSVRFGSLRDGQPFPVATEIRDAAHLADLQRQDAYIRRYAGARALATGSSATYQTVLGPDGKRYVVSGSVDLEVSRTSGDPRAVQREAAYVRRIVEAGPLLSPADRAIALEARLIEREAERELTDAEPSYRGLYTAAGRLVEPSSGNTAFMLTV